MKKPKKIRRYCKYCRKHTEQKVSTASAGRGAAADRKGSKQRARKRGRARGMGNLGRYSKKAVGQWKRKTKSTKKTNIVYTCTACHKKTLQKKGIRTGRLMLE